jgi:type I restriction enzyme M protein
MLMYRTGAAIPSVSDADFANVLIYLPDEKKIEEISRRVKRAFELRAESRKELENIELNFL